MAASAAAIWGDPQHCVAFAKGRVALHAILRTLGIGAGDEVLLPAFTCVAVPAAILYTGATPRFVDIDPDTLNMSEANLRGALVRPPRAVLLQHSFGSPCIPDALLAELSNAGVLIIEDCAHAMGGSHRGKALGSFGDAAFTSLQWSKTVSCGLGGIARVSDPAVAAELRKLSLNYPEPPLSSTLALGVAESLHARFLRPKTQFRARQIYHRLVAWGLLPGSSSASELMRPAIPRGYQRRYPKLRETRMKEVLASVESTIARRRSIAARFRRWLAENDFWTQSLPDGAVSTHLRVPLRVISPESVLAAARRDGLELGDWFNAPIHPKESPASAFGYEAGSCPLAEEAATQLINLPTHLHVRDVDVDRTLAFLDRHRTLIVGRDRRVDRVEKNLLESQCE